MTCQSAVPEGVQRRIIDAVTNEEVQIYGPDEVGMTTCVWEETLALYVGVDKEIVPVPGTSEWVSVRARGVGTCICDIMQQSFPAEAHPAGLS